MTVNKSKRRGSLTFKYQMEHQQVVELQEQEEGWSVKERWCSDGSGRRAGRLASGEAARC